jgi:hypothetical protein
MGSFTPSICAGRSVLRPYEKRVAISATRLFFHFSNFDFSIFELRSLRALVPGSEVVFLLRRELINQHAHRLKLELGDLLIKMLGH